MSLSERSRNHLYTGLSAVIDDQEAVDEMLSHFPARDLDEPVTREHLRAEVALLDGRITTGLAALDKKMTEGFAAMDGRITTMDGRITTGLAAAQVETVALDKKLTEQFATIPAQFATMKGELGAEMRTWFMRTMALILTSVIGLIGLIVFLASQGGPTP